ncbi:MAG: flippase [Candidatus Ratteibacteria bacterium]
MKNYLQSYGRIPRNTLILYISNLITSLISLFFFGILARYLGVSNFGVFSYVYAFMTVAQTTGAFGLDMFMIREISSDIPNAMNTAGGIFVLKILFSFLALVIAIIVILLSNFDAATYKSLLIFSPYIILSNLNLTLWYIGDGYQKMEYRGLFTIIYYFMRTVAGLIVFQYTRDITILFAYLLLVEFLVLIITLLTTNRYFGKIKLIISKDRLRKICASSFPFAIGSILSVSLLRMDILILEALEDKTAVGFYSPAQKLVNMILLFSTAFSFAFYPAMSHSSKTSEKNAYNLFINSMKIMLVIGLLFSLSMTLITTPVISIIFGSEYLVSAKILKILIWMSPPYFCASILWMLFAVKNYQHWTMIIYLAVFPFTFLMNVLLVKQLSFFGTALAMVLFSFVIFIITFITYYKKKEQLFNMSELK